MKNYLSLLLYFFFLFHFDIYAQNEYELSVCNNDIAYSNGQHCAFTNLMRYNGDLYLCFRDGVVHAPKIESEYGSIRILKYSNYKWEEFAYISDSRYDLRDPFLSITPNGKLFLLCGVNQIVNGKLSHVGTLYCIAGQNGFSALNFINNDIDHISWLWKFRWHNEIAYGVAYLEGENPVLLSSKDLINWNTIATLDIPDGIPTEADLVFISDNEMKIVIRRDTSTTYIGNATFPFTEWEWKDTKTTIQSPSLYFHVPTNKLLLAGRLVLKDSVKTELFEIVENDSLQNIISLNSLALGNDAGYPSIIENGDSIFISYYSGNSLSTDIYVSKLIFSKKYILPKIISQPNDTTIVEGDSAIFVFHILENGNEVSYQWYENGNIIPEATDSVYVKSNVSLQDNRNTYYCVAKDSRSFEETSATATLSVEKTVSHNIMNNLSNISILQNKKQLIISSDDLVGSCISIYNLQGYCFKRFYARENTEIISDLRDEKVIILHIFTNTKKSFANKVLIVRK